MSGDCNVCGRNGVEERRCPFAGERTVLNEMLDEQRSNIAQLVSQVEDLKLQFDLVLNERNDAMAESASAKSVHETLVRNLTSMSEFAGKVLRERDGAMAEAEELRRKLHERRQELKPAWVTSEHHEAFQALHDENQRLRDQLAAADVERRHAVAAVGEDADRFRAERDEARREVCELRCNPPERFIGLSHELAKINGWDCFREVTP